MTITEAATRASVERAPHAYMFHHETRTVLDTQVEDAFAYLDDFRKLSAHMERPSGMMFGSKMKIEVDGQEGRAVGAKVRMSGQVVGMRIELEEVVVERHPPVRKAWEILNAKLLVIGDYRLGFEIEPKGSLSAVRVLIDYDLPAKSPGRWLGRLFGHMYARWCTERMAADARGNFALREPK